MKLKIKNNKKNIIYMLIGRITTYLLIYVVSIMTTVKILELIVNNCITTLK